MAIQVSRPIPEVTVEAYMRGEEQPLRLSLSALQGQWVVLFFYPRDFTFICPTELQSFAELHATFERERALLLAASTDSYYVHKAWFEGDPRLAGVNYPVIADTNHQLGRAFDVLLESGDALRATFIIDPDGILRHSQINDLDVGRNVSETLRTLQALRTGQLCPHAWQPGMRTLSEELVAA